MPGFTEDSRPVSEKILKVFLLFFFFAYMNMTAILVM